MDNLAALRGSRNENSQRQFSRWLLTFLSLMLVTYERKLLAGKDRPPSAALEHRGLQDEGFAKRPLRRTLADREGSGAGQHARPDCPPSCGPGWAPLPRSPRAMAAPIPRPRRRHLGPLCVPLRHSAAAPGLPLPRRLQPTGTGYVAEPRHCRHLVGVRSHIALKHMGFQHQQTKTPPFAFGIGSVASIDTKNLVTLLRLSRTPCWTVNP